MADVKKLLSPFLKSDTYWYIPRAFWPYASQPEGIPGFHEFIRLLPERQRWGRDADIEILDKLRSNGFLRETLDEADDYHVHYRNRVNFARKMGLIKSSGREGVTLTEVGNAFAQASEARWLEIFEHQLIKWQFTNPTLPEAYNSFQLFPYIFTLSVISEVQGNFITLDELVLRVSLSKNQAEKEEVIKWIDDFRSLSDTDRELAHSQIDLLRHYAGRMVMLMFAYTPSLSFLNNTLTIRDPDRIGLILGRAWPRLTFKTYTPTEWDSFFGEFNPVFWPLVPKARVMKQRKRQYKKYVRREGSVEHKNLKQYVIENAETLFGLGTRLVQEEYYFPSSDRANLVFILPDGRWLTVEVEVNVPENDIVGLLQAIKYKYMCAVQERLNFDQIRTALIAHSVHQTVKGLCSRYGVEVYEV
jgi:hypothetical protein